MNSPVSSRTCRMAAMSYVWWGVVTAVDEDGGGVGCHLTRKSPPLWGREWASFWKVDFGPPERD